MGDKFTLNGVAEMLCISRKPGNDDHQEIMDYYSSPWVAN
jgi:hypothetical protein